MVKLDHTITEIEGKVGGNVWRKDVCGQHVQAFPRMVGKFKPSPSQKAFTRSKNAWMSHVWTQPELDLWWTWCYQHPKMNKKGETTYLHPFLEFLSVNTKRILNDKEIVYEPPS